MNGSFSGRGLKKWNMPSRGQAAVIILIFGLPIAAGVLFIDMIPQSLRTVLFIIWFIAAFVIYVYILSHGKGKQKTTIVEHEGLTGEFTIDNSFMALSSIYFFAGSLGALLNGYYVIGFVIVLTGFGVIFAAKYFRKKLRFDENGIMFLQQKGGELQIDFTRLNFAECRQNKMSARQIYRPRIKLQISDHFGENHLIKLKINVLRSQKFGTYSDPRLIMYYIKDKCSEQNMNITYLDVFETDFTAQRI